jgi:hypothetical protein
LPIFDWDLLQIGADTSSIRRRSNDVTDSQQIRNREERIGGAGDTQKDQVNATRTSGGG